MKFAAPLKGRLVELLDVDRSYIEKNKENKSGLLKRVSDGELDSLRQALIADSEYHLKTRYGDNIFGRIAVVQMARSSYPLILFSDCGFKPEVDCVLKAVGSDNSLLIRLHRSGKTYDNDSRSHLPDGMCHTIDVYNDDSIHNVAMQCLSRIRKYLGVELMKEPEQWIK